MTIDRRAFLFGSSSMAALPLLPRAINAAGAADPSLAVNADMEVSSLHEYDAGNFRLVPANENPLTLSTAQARVGTQSLEFYLSRPSSPVPYRTAITTSKSMLDFFKTHWFGFSIYVPADWRVSSTWEVLWQIHHQPADWVGRGFSPVLALRIEENTDKWLIRQNYVQTKEGQQSSSDRKTAFHTVLREPIARGTWTDWVVEYRPDWRNAADGGKGVTRWWRNGEKVIDYRGPNAINNKNTHYLNFGVYKSAWKDRNHRDPVAERLYYYDAIRVAKPDQGYYELVTPDGPQTARPLAPQLLIETG